MNLSSYEKTNLSSPGTLEAGKPYGRGGQVEVIQESPLPNPFPSMDYDPFR